MLISAGDVAFAKNKFKYRTDLFEVLRSSENSKIHFDLKQNQHFIFG